MPSRRLPAQNVAQLKWSKTAEHDPDTAKKLAAKAKREAEEAAERAAAEKAAAEAKAAEAARLKAIAEAEAAEKAAKKVRLRFRLITAQRQPMTPH